MCGSPCTWLDLAADGFPETSLREAQVGRPRYEISFEQLTFLVGENFNTRRITNCLGVSPSTVQRRLRDNGMRLDQTYSSISDTDLDHLIRSVRAQFPRIG